MHICFPSGSPFISFCGPISLFLARTRPGHGRSLQNENNSPRGLNPVGAARCRCISAVNHKPGRAKKRRRERENNGINVRRIQDTNGRRRAGMERKVETKDGDGNGENETAQKRWRRKIARDREGRVSVCNRIVTCTSSSCFHNYNLFKIRIGAARW